MMQQSTPPIPACLWVAALVLTPMAARATSPTCDLSDSQKINQTFQKMSHNTYEHATYADALNAVKAVEIDVWTPWKLCPHKTTIGLQVHHNRKPLCSSSSTCGPDGNGNLSACLKDVKAWHDAHPNHDVATIFIDKKDDWWDGVYGPDELDTAVKSKIGASNIFMPSRLKGTYQDLRTAARSQNWPSRSDLKGKFMFILTGGALFNHNKTQNEYLKDQGDAAVFFVCPDADESSDIWGTPDQFSDANAQNVICYNFQYGDLDGTTLGREVMVLGGISHVWDIDEDDATYTEVLGDFISNIGLDDYSVTKYNNGRMNGSYWCPNEPYSIQKLTTVNSEGKPQKGQKHRSSDNFSLSPPANSVGLTWVVSKNSKAKSIDYKVMEDKSGWWDRTVFTGELTGVVMSPVVKGTSFYISDPENTGDNSFTVEIYAIVASK